VLISLRGDATSTPSAAGLEVCRTVALSDSILCMCGVPIVCLTTTVSVSPRAIRAAHDQLRFLSFTGGEHSVFNLPLHISNQEIQFACFGDVNVGHEIVSEGVLESIHE